MAHNKKEFRRNRIKMRVRKKISGTSECPRMSIFRSNRDIYVQIIDDIAGHTLAFASSAVTEIKNKKITKTAQSALVGKIIAEKATTAGVTSVVFDRNGYLYHGRVKSLADAAREGGLIF